MRIQSYLNKLMNPKSFRNFFKKILEIIVYQIDLVVSFFKPYEYNKETYEPRKKVYDRKPKKIIGKIYVHKKIKKYKCLKCGDMINHHEYCVKCDVELKLNEQTDHHRWKF